MKVKKTGHPTYLFVFAKVIDLGPIFKISGESILINE
jgi:hypothetical protein